MERAVATTGRAIVVWGALAGQCLLAPLVAICPVRCRAATLIPAAASCCGPCRPQPAVAPLADAVACACCGPVDPIAGESPVGPCRCRLDDRPVAVRIAPGGRKAGEPRWLDGVPAPPLRAAAWRSTAGRVAAGEQRPTAATRPVRILFGVWRN